MRCSTTNCKKERAKHRTICYSCIIRRFAEKHPEKYVYFVLKNNAKRRKKDFTITFEDFMEFAVKCDYMHSKGIGKTSMHVDRIKEHLGYVKGNIQGLLNTNNIKKYLEYCYNGPGHGDFRYRVKKELDQREYPF